MNDYNPPTYPAAGFDPSQLNGRSSQLPEHQGRGSKTNAKALHEQRKNHGRNNTSSVTDTSQYHVEHLTTFVMDRKEAMMTVEDGIRKLKLLDAKGKVWTQEMLLQVEEKAVRLIDMETKNELENFPLGTIQHSQALLNACSYDSILALMCKEPSQSKADLHLFQCEHVKANLIHADIDSAMSDYKGGKVKKRPEVLRMILKSDGAIPPPPAGPAPDLLASQMGVKSRVATWSASMGNEQRDFGSYTPYLEENERPEVMAARIDCDVQILNHILDDIESFITKLQRAAEAFDELSKRNKLKKNKKKGPGEGVLTLRARPPVQEEFIDCFQKFKLAFNLLGKLRSHIQNPSALDLVHFLFTPLNMVIQATGGVDMAMGVISPLLTPEAVDFLRSVTNPQERRLWGSLGDGWTKSRAEWPQDQQPPSYSPSFRNDWQPPMLAFSGHGQEQELSPRLQRPESGERRLSQEQPRVTDFASADRSYEARSRPEPKNFAKSKYDFVARNGTELSVLKDEIVEVLDDRKQWWKVQNDRGASGFVPNNILQTSRPDAVYTHTFQLMMPKKEFELFKQLLGELNEKQRSDDIPKPATNPSPSPPASAAVQPSTPALPPAASAAVVQQARSDTCVEQQDGIILSDKCGVPMRDENLRDSPLPINHRKSNMEEVQDELIHRLTLGRSAQKNIQIPARRGNFAANITYDSNAEEVKAWLQMKGFSPATISSLGVLTGAQLFSLSKEELKTVCPDDGARVYSQATVQKAALERTSCSELQEIMRRRQEKLNAAALDSGVESFDEGSSH